MVKLSSSVFLLILGECSSWTSIQQPPTFSRRGWATEFTKAFLGVSSIAPLVIFSDETAAKPSEDEDKQKIIKGYQRLNYLLENWESETTVCGRGDNPYVTGKGCERTPIKIMEYLGYKSTADPLFKAEKTLQRLEPLVPADREVEFLDAVETFAQAADEASGTAYISSWGEANPGGGKDRVQYFIERSKKNVLDARDSLKLVLDILQVPL